MGETMVESFQKIIKRKRWEGRDRACSHPTGNRISDAFRLSLCLWDCSLSRADFSPQTRFPYGRGKWPPSSLQTLTCIALPTEERSPSEPSMVVSREGLQLARMGHCGLEAGSYKGWHLPVSCIISGSYISRSAISGMTIPILQMNKQRLREEGTWPQSCGFHLHGNAAY